MPLVGFYTPIDNDFSRNKAFLHTIPNSLTMWRAVQSRDGRTSTNYSARRRLRSHSSSAVWAERPPVEDVTARRAAFRPFRVVLLWSRRRTVHLASSGKYGASLLLNLELTFSALLAWIFFDERMMVGTGGRDHKGIRTRHNYRRQIFAHVARWTGRYVHGIQGQAPPSQ